MGWRGEKVGGGGIKEKEEEEKKEEEKEEEKEKRGEAKWKGYFTHTSKKTKTNTQKKKKKNSLSGIRLPSHQSEWSLAPQLHLGSLSYLQRHCNQTKYRGHMLMQHVQQLLLVYALQT